MNHKKYSYESISNSSCSDEDEYIFEQKSKFDIIIDNIKYIIGKILNLCQKK